jgi:hypothetical protein
MEETNSLVKLIKDKRLADFKQQLDEIYEYVVRVEDISDKALATVRDWNKDSEIQKLQEEMLSLKSKLYNDYTLTSDEYTEVKKWQTDHVTRDHQGKHSGYWSYKFTPTEIGTVGVCICEHCHKEFMFREP